VDYLTNTLRHLDDIGIHEPKLHGLLREVERIAGNRPDVQL
jgi:cation transport regulator ChaC